MRCSGQLSVRVAEPWKFSRWVPDGSSTFRQSVSVGCKRTASTRPKQRGVYRLLPRGIPLNSFGQPDATSCHHLHHRQHRQHHSLRPRGRHRRGQILDLGWMSAEYHKNRMCRESVNAVLHDALCGQKVWAPTVGLLAGVEAAVGCEVWRRWTESSGRCAAASGLRRIAERVCKRRCEARLPRPRTLCAPNRVWDKGYGMGYITNARPPTRIGLVQKRLRS
jgi:hypothetical protein